MADEEKKADPETEEKPAKADNPMMKYLIMVGVALTMAAVGYFVTLKFIKPMVTDSHAETATADEEDDDSHDTQGEGEKKKKKHIVKDEKGEVVSHIFAVDDIIVNPAGTGGTRFLSVSIGFELEDEETLSLFEARKPQIRDALITILGSKNIEQLTDMKQKEIARLQIKKRVEFLLETEELMAIYFTNFVIQ